MIFKDEPGRLHIIFGDGDVASALGINKEENSVMLALQELNTAVAVGSTTSEKFDYTKCHALLHFKSIKAIDVVIGWLEEAKKHHAKYYGESNKSCETCKHEKRPCDDQKCLLENMVGSEYAYTYWRPKEDHIEKQIG